MKKIKAFCQRICFDEDGATAVEYAVMLALIIVTAVGAILNSGDVQQAMWFNTATVMEEVSSVEGLSGN